MLNKENPTLIQISKLISNFFNPINSMLIFFIYYSTKHFTLKESLQYFLPILIITIIPVSLWILSNVISGKYTNIDVSNRNQRKSLYFFIEGSLFIYLVYDYLATGKIELIMLFIFILIVAMQISNYFIKSSMHTAFNVFVAALFYSENEKLGFLWLFISFLVGCSRIILKRHSVKEVISGALIALIISFAYLYTNNHFQQ